MPVLSTYKLDGNLFVYGKLESGCIKEDYWVTCLPSRNEV